MRRITVCLCLAVLTVGLCVGHASAVTLNFSVTFDETTFRDCNEHFCRLLARIYECHSSDIEKVAASYRTDYANAININVNVNHSSSWFSWLKNLFKWTKANAPVHAVTPTVPEQEPEPEPVSASQPKTEPEPSELVELVNRRDYSWLKKFYDAVGLVRVDYVSNIPRENYFTEGGRTFCEVFPGGSTPVYGFVDRDSLLDALKSFYGGGFSVSGSSSFSFRLSLGNEINLKAEEFLLSTESLSPVKAEREKSDREKFGFTRFFFKTNLKGVELVVVPKDSRQRTRFFLAANKSIVDVGRLQNSLDRNIESGSGRVTFRFFTPVDMIERRDFENCIEIFVRQILEKSEVFETAR